MPLFRQKTNIGFFFFLFSFVDISSVMRDHELNVPHFPILKSKSFSVLFSLAGYYLGVFFLMLYLIFYLTVIIFM